MEKMEHDMRRLHEISPNCTSSPRPSLSRAVTDPANCSSKDAPVGDRLPVTDSGFVLQGECPQPRRSTLPVPIYQEGPHEHHIVDDLTMESDRCTAGSFSSAANIGQIRDQITRGRSNIPESVFLQLRAMSQDRYYSLYRFLGKDGSPSTLDVIENAKDTLDNPCGDRAAPLYPMKKRRRMSLETDLMMVGAFVQDFEDPLQPTKPQVRNFAQDHVEYESLFHKPHYQPDITPYYRNSF